jgi:tetratricopeptide (TPR) repeat protein
MSESTKTRTNQGKGTTKRRWRVPQPLLRDAEAPGPVGLYVLEEFSSELGMVLWKSLRSVMLWADVEPRDRKGLFDEGAAERRHLEIVSTVPEEESELREALEQLVAVLSDPERADREAVGVACTRISTWAEGRSAPRTALEFIQAAALACPANPRFALMVGRGARDMAQYGRAEAWLYRTVGLARQVKDWEAYIRAYLAHGKMMMRRGALPAARRSFVKARRRATRQGLRAFEAMSYHDLFVLESYAGNNEQALDHAERATRAYGRRHEDFPTFAHDVAHFWMEQGDYEHALPIFSEALNRIREGLRPFVLGSLARASGGLRDREGFEWAFAELERIPAGPGVAESWVEVARGAILLGSHEDARRAAEFAERVARTRGESQIQFMAEGVIQEAEAEARAAEARRVGAAEAPSVGARRDDLARTLLRTLRTEASGT